MEAAQETQIAHIVIEKIRALGIARLPIAEILAGLDKLGESMPQVSPTSREACAEGDQQANISTFVRVSRNVSPANRHALEGAGLHWNGKAGGWNGRVTQDALAGLRARFGDRVSTAVPEAAAAGGQTPPSTAVETVEAQSVAAAEPFPVAEPQAAREGAPSPS